MADRELTPAEAEVLAETSAYLKAEIERRLAGKAITAAAIREAALGAIEAFDRQLFEAIEIERDPNDANRINVYLPAALAHRLNAVRP